MPMKLKKLERIFVNHLDSTTEPRSMHSMEWKKNKCSEIIRLYLSVPLIGPENPNSIRVPNSKLGPLDDGSLLPIASISTAKLALLRVFPIQPVADSRTAVLVTTRLLCVKSVDILEIYLTELRKKFNPEADKYCNCI